MVIVAAAAAAAQTQIMQTHAQTELALLVLATLRTLFDGTIIEATTPLTTRSRSGRSVNRQCMIVIGTETETGTTVIIIIIIIIIIHSQNRSHEGSGRMEEKVMSKLTGAAHLMRKRTTRVLVVLGGANHPLMMNMIKGTFYV